MSLEVPAQPASNSGDWVMWAERVDVEMASSPDDLVKRLNLIAAFRGRSLPAERLLRTGQAEPREK